MIAEANKNLYAAYIDELQRQTGQTWYGAFATHCEPGQWNGSGCNRDWYQGIGVFSMYRITSSSQTFFPYADCWTSARVGLRAQIDVNGLPVQVFANHLQTGGCSNDAQLRYNSMRDFKAWASNYLGRRSWSPAISTPIPIRSTRRRACRRTSSIRGSSRARAPASRRSIRIPR